MKALSIKQPWAELILKGRKVIECRTWAQYGMVGEQFYIHASKGKLPIIERYFSHEGFYLPADIERGYLVGVVTLAGIRHYSPEYTFDRDVKHHLCHESICQPTEYGLILSRVERIKPIPYKGALGFFNISL